MVDVMHVSSPVTKATPLEAARGTCIRIDDEWTGIETLAQFVPIDPPTHAVICNAQYRAIWGCGSATVATVNASPHTVSTHRYRRWRLPTVLSFKQPSLRE